MPVGVGSEGEYVIEVEFDRQGNVVSGVGRCDVSL
jgi:hypothetical protein